MITLCYPRNAADGGVLIRRGQRGYGRVVDAVQISNRYQCISRTFKEKAMEDIPNRRTDEQLEVILAETGHWVVYGKRGRVLFTAPTLRRALDKSVQLSASGAVVIAICRLPSDNIIVFPEQIERMQKIIAGRDPGPHNAA